MAATLALQETKNAGTLVPLAFPEKSRAKWALSEQVRKSMLESCLAEAQIALKSRKPSGPPAMEGVRVHPTKGMDDLVQELIMDKMAFGDLMTISDLCEHVSERWLVAPKDFFGLWHGDTDAFLFSGLPFQMVYLHGQVQVLVNPSDFECFMQKSL